LFCAEAWFCSALLSDARALSTDCASLTFAAACAFLSVVIELESVNNFAGSAVTLL
jgi:hypothetical protein